MPPCKIVLDTTSLAVVCSFYRQGDIAMKTISFLFVAAYTAGLIAGMALRLAA
jgi:hypothetical protein